jgi:hypothetical protein
MGGSGAKFAHSLSGDLPMATHDAIFIGGSYVLTFLAGYAARAWLSGVRRRRALGY